jgi:hypothetical protein
MNKLLQLTVDDIAQLADPGLLQLPTSVVNDIIILGHTGSPTNVLKAACAGMAPNVVPKACSCLDQPVNQFAACAAPGPSTLPGWAIGLISAIVLVAVGAGGLVGMFYYRDRQVCGNLRRQLQTPI